MRQPEDKHLASQHNDKIITLIVVHVHNDWSRGSDLTVVVDSQTDAIAFLDVREMRPQIFPFASGDRP